MLSRGVVQKNTLSNNRMALNKEKRKSIHYQQQDSSISCNGAIKSAENEQNVNILASPPKEVSPTKSNLLWWVGAWGSGLGFGG